MLLSILTIGKTWNMVYDRGCVRVRASGRHNPILKFNVRMVGILSSASKCNGRQGKLLLERPWRDSTETGGTVYTVLDSKP
jgi:hypothetical protein